MRPCSRGIVTAPNSSVTSLDDALDRRRRRRRPATSSCAQPESKVAGRSVAPAGVVRRTDDGSALLGQAWAIGRADAALAPSRVRFSFSSMASSGPRRALGRIVHRDRFQVLVDALVRPASTLPGPPPTISVAPSPRAAHPSRPSDRACGAGAPGGRAPRPRVAATATSTCGRTGSGARTGPTPCGVRAARSGTHQRNSARAR